MAFHFKQFEVEDKQSTLRIGTDAMLLGSWAKPVNASKILDIGTGCGVLALMMAQKSEAVIIAIEIDLPSVKESRMNFTYSPWAERISAIHTTLQAFSGYSKCDYDFIITNPPFFSNALKSPSVRENKTRHDVTMSHPELVRNVSRLLTRDGTFALILPAGYEKEFITVCSEYGLNLMRRLIVCPKPAALPGRTLMEFTRQKVNQVNESDLIILNSTGEFSDQYLALTRDFHNF